MNPLSFVRRSFVVLFVVFPLLLQPTAAGQSLAEDPLNPAAASAIKDWANIGLYGGYVEAFAFDTAREIVYACVKGTTGVYKSSIHEIQWVPLEGTLGPCRGIAYDGNTDYLLWNDGGALFRSKSDPIVWEKLIDPDQPLGLKEIAQNPNKTGELLLPSGTGVLYHTTDAGDTWTKAVFIDGEQPPVDQLSADTGPIAIDPLNPQNIYLIVGQHSSAETSPGVFASGDGGITFHRIFTQENTDWIRAAVSYTGEA